VQPTTTAPAGGADVPDTETLRAEVAQNLGLPVDAVLVTETTMLPGADACLGVYAAGSACYRARLEASGQVLFFHINEQGAYRNVADSPRPEPGEVILTWGADQCQVSAIGRPDWPVAVGPCQSEFTSFDLVQEKGIVTAQLDYLVSQYAPFDAITAAGLVAFGGRGQASPNEAEQRMIAEWAQYVAETAAGGQDDLPDRLALSWQRVGGIAGFCNTLNVYRTGYAEAYEACGDLLEDAAPVATGFLTAGQAAQLFDWLDSLPTFEYAQTDPATADAMTINYLFRGAAGMDTIEPADEVKRAVDLWAADIFTTIKSSPPTANSGLCPEVPRPALVMFDGRQYLIVDPASQERCAFDFPGETPGGMQVAGDALYYAEYGGGSGGGQVWRLGADGSAAPLAFTFAKQQTSNLLGFRVSDDGSLIAWSAGRAGAGTTTSDLWVAGVGGENPVALVTDQEAAENRMLVPIRFSADGATLYYALQPIGIGGAWPSFSGRYDSVFAIPVAGGEPLLLADCPTEGLFMCVGDVTQYGTIAYTDVNAHEIVVRDQAGEVIGRIPYAAEYAGYPTFSPGGHLAFYTAELEDDPESGVPTAAPGNLYFIGAPYQGEPGLLVTGDGVGQPLTWLGENQVAFNRSASPVQWGVAVAAIEGGDWPIEPWPPAADEPPLQYLAAWLEPVISVELLSSLTLDRTTATSPDGAWEVEVAVSDPFVVQPGEQERYYTRLTVANASGDVTYTVMERIGPWGLGYTRPGVYSWSADGERLYVTNVPVPDGCPGYVNGSDLYRVDLANGRVTRILPEVGLVVALSPDERQVAYLAYGGRGVVVRDVATGAEWEAGLTSDARVVADLRWSPDSQGLMLVQWTGACPVPGDPATTFVWLDVPGQLSRTLVENAPGHLGVAEWSAAETVLLQDEDGNRWVLDVTGGVLTEA
jgi:hypothetical protein